MAAKRVDRQNADNRAGYAATLETITKKGFCPFCPEYLFEHHTKPVLFKNAEWLVTENAWPYDGTRHHFVLIARKHIEDAAKLSPKEWADLGAIYKKVISAYGLKGATLLMRSGATHHTGASVAHLHAQIIVGRPRQKSSEKITAVVGFKKNK